MSFSFRPVSYRLNQLQSFAVDMQTQADASFFGGSVVDALKKHGSSPHSSHPDFAHLVLLVFEAVLEVVFISLPGYILARMGNFDAKQQKFIAEMNTALFTPALIFTKLASQLTAEKLVDLAIIPVIFVIQTLICYLSAELVAKLFRFKKRARYFVIAMAVFGNSNSLPISLVISLSMTLKGLHWDRIPGDNDSEVAARGILYLLIFQQLGQVVRWSWGYNVLLAPADQFPDEDEGRNSALERGEYLANDPDLAAPLLADDTFLDDGEEQFSHADRYRPQQDIVVSSAPSHSDYESGTATPFDSRYMSSSSSTSLSLDADASSSSSREIGAALINGKAIPRTLLKPKDLKGNDHIASFPEPSPTDSHAEGSMKLTGRWWSRAYTRARDAVKRGLGRTGTSIHEQTKNCFRAMPPWVQSFLTAVGGFFVKIWNGLNPPLWAMLAAIIVASVPQLQHLFYDKGTFVNNSLTRAVSQSGGVAVPLILVVLGGNLARNTLPEAEQKGTQLDPKFERNLLIASLVSRMVLPFVIMAPVLALTAKYVPVSILDDPIFVIVCFLLTGAPTALQLAQICQMNDVYMSVMSKILFQSYVVWILPSTLVLVMVALEVVEWAVQ